MTQLPVEEPRPFGEDISVIMLLSSGPKRQLIQAACFLVQLFPEGGAGTAARLGVSDPLCWNPGPSPSHVERGSGQSYTLSEPALIYLKTSFQALCVKQPSPLERVWYSAWCKVGGQ